MRVQGSECSVVSTPAGVLSPLASVLCTLDGGWSTVVSVLCTLESVLSTRESGSDSRHCLLERVVAGQDHAYECGVCARRCFE